MEESLESKIIRANLPMTIMASTISTVATFVNNILIGVWMTNTDLYAATSLEMNYYYLRT